MAIFSTDADLLGYEPNVFVDLLFVCQRILLVSDGQISGKTVTSVTGGFSGLTVGQVAMIGSSVSDIAGYEIQTITDDNTIELVNAPVGLAASSGLTVQVRTFQAQRDIVHQQLVRSVGVDSDTGEVDESAIVSVGLMKRLEVLGILWRGYRGAIGLTGDNQEVRGKAEEYELRFNQELRGAAVLMDLDGDGEGEVVRWPGVGSFVRV